ncbi:MAG: hypothetical protein LDL39_18015 [Magnetospirillum sp.]|nr:hypothetical protein [Magnetospirillum sp.]
MPNAKSDKNTTQEVVAEDDAVPPDNGSMDASTPIPALLQEMLAVLMDIRDQQARVEDRLLQIEESSQRTHAQLTSNIGYEQRRARETNVSLANIEATLRDERRKNDRIAEDLEILRLRQSAGEHLGATRSGIASQSYSIEQKAASAHANSLHLTRNFQ